MCQCNPIIKGLWCDKCRPPLAAPDPARFADVLGSLRVFAADNNRRLIGRGIDDFSAALGGGHDAEVRRFIDAIMNASVDAALMLVDKLLPGWTWAADASAPECGIDWELFGPNGQSVKATAPAAWLAILIALFEALKEKVPS